MWALGVMVYMMICGSLPFVGKPDEIKKRAAAGYVPFHDPVWNQVSDSAKDLVMHLICVDPLKRFDAKQVQHSVRTLPWC